MLHTSKSCAESSTSPMFPASNCLYSFLTWTWISISIQYYTRIFALSLTSLSWFQPSKIIWRGDHSKLLRLSPLLTPTGKDKPEVDLVLDCITNVLAWDSEVVAACYHNKTMDTTSTANGIAIMVNLVEEDRYQFPDTPFICILVPDGLSHYLHKDH